MQIVHQSALSSYSLVPPHPLLAAPPVPLMLPAPKVSGLLAAPKLTIVVEHYDPFDEILKLTGPLKSIEELDAELYAEMKSPLTRAIFDVLRSRREQQ